jgi:transposase
MGRRGRKRRLDIESEYWLLLASGVGTAEACKRLGIGRKTGYRWRVENGGLPPATLSEGSRSQRYLSLLERRRIATLRRDGLSVRQIAEQLGRSPSTISRELRRNTAAHDHSYDGDWHTPERAKGRVGRVVAAYWSTRSCARTSRRNSNWSGAPNRSPAGCALRFQSGLTGTSATRPSIRRFTSADGAGCAASSPADYVPAGRFASGAAALPSGGLGS